MSALSPNFPTLSVRMGVVWYVCTVVMSGCVLYTSCLSSLHLLLIQLLLICSMPMFCLFVVAWVLCVVYESCLCWCCVAI